MAKAEPIIPLRVTDLEVDTENYRIGPQTGQHEAIQAMIEEQGEKLVELLKDILANGLSPIDLITVTPAADPDKYRVIEGNRRITALKLLNEPALAHGTAIEKAIRALALKNVGAALNQCDCRVLPSKQAAFVWIQRRHDTGLGGAAIIPWNAMAIRRAKEAAGNRQSALEVIDYIDQKAGLSESEKRKLAAMPVTNLERLLEDPFAMSKLGIEIRSGDVICSKDSAWTTQALKQITTDVATKRIQVKDIFDKNKREGYVDRIIASIPQRSSKVRPWSLAKGTAGTSTSSAKAPGPSVVHDRKTLIPTSCKLQIQHARINAIYDELRRKLRVADVPNSVAVMFRVFVELGIDNYIAKNRITSKSDKLHAKITAVADYMEQNGVMPKKALKPARMAVANPNELHSTETLNAYVHNASVHPQAGDLKRSWDSMEQFVTQLWT